MSNFNQNPFQTNSNGGSFGNQGPKWDFRDVNAPAMSAGKLANAFITRVFTIMALGLGITGLVSWLFATQYLETWQAAESFYGSGIGYVLIFSPLVFILVIGFGIHKLSYSTSALVFTAFAVVMGLSLSSIFFTYSLGSIFQVFLMTSVTFGLMALLGATTNIDLTKFGSILIFAAFGVIAVSLVNFFMHSETVSYIVSGIGVLVFSGLVAYNTQRLLRIGAQVELGNESANKMALMGALNLYIDFINIFLFLLRLFGGGNRN